MVIVLILFGVILAGGGALAGSLVTSGIGLFLIVLAILLEGVSKTRQRRALRRTRKGDFETFHIDKPPGGNWWRIP
jgi:hypothetical protein